MIAGKGKCFRTTWKKVRELVDQDIPVILFGLDMFHLPYQGKFYHKRHIHGHIVLMTGYDEANVYEMAVAVREVPEGTKLTEENIGQYFEMRKCDASLDTQYNIKELDELKRKYSSKQIYANTIVHAYDFSDSDFKNEAIKEKVLVSFGVGSLANSLSGTLQMGDVVNSM